MSLLDWVAACVACIGVALIVADVRERLVSARPSRCRGHHAGWPALLPASWFIRHRCGYDLTGLAGAGASTCPECGRVSTLAQAVRLPGRYRLGAAGAVVLAVSGVTWRIASAGDRWPSLVPTLALVVTERTLDEMTPAPLRVELRDRISNRTLSAMEARVIAPSLIADLASDDDTYNAMSAMWDLTRLGRPAAPALRRALRSSDWQQRQLAGEVLCGLTQPWWDDTYQLREPRMTTLEVATDDMLRVCLEALKSDDLPRTLNSSQARRAYTYVNNAVSAFTLLRACPEQTRRLVAPGLDSPDLQERFLSAALAAECGSEDLRARAASILVAHLRDNNLSCDSSFAAWALARAGAAAYPALASTLEDPDAQARRTAAAVLRVMNSAEGAGVMAPTSFERGIAADVRRDEPDPSWFRDLER